MTKLARFVAPLLSCAVMAACALSGCATDHPDLDVGLEEDQELPPGAPTQSCDAGTHACPGADPTLAVCVADQLNLPELGCARGCGAPCPYVVFGEPSCTPEGHCLAACYDEASPSLDDCQGAVCVVQRAACGSVTDSGGNIFDCGPCVEGACGPDHRCLLAGDAREPNNTSAQAVDLGAFNDADDSWLQVDDLRISSETDEDWFRFRLEDGFDAGNPDAAIVLFRDTHSQTYSPDLLDSAHELTVWFKCDTADAGSVVSCNGLYTQGQLDNSLTDPVLGVGCQNNTRFNPTAHVDAYCGGTTDSGVVTVRVRKDFPPRGDRYDLYLDVD